MGSSSGFTRGAIAKSQSTGIDCLILCKDNTKSDREPDIKARALLIQRTPWAVIARSSRNEGHLPTKFTIEDEDLGEPMQKLAIKLICGRKPLAAWPANQRLSEDFESINEIIEVRDKGGNIRMIDVISGRVDFYVLECRFPFVFASYKDILKNKDLCVVGAAHIHMGLGSYNQLVTILQSNEGEIKISLDKTREAEWLISNPQNLKAKKEENTVGYIWPRCTRVQLTFKVTKSRDILYLLNHDKAEKLTTMPVLNEAAKPATVYCTFDLISDGCRL
jgi:hypothetical protein